MGKSLIDAVFELHSFYDVEYKDFHLPKAFYNPGYIVTLCAYLNSNKIYRRDFHCDCNENQSYFDAMNLNSAIWGGIFNSNGVNAGKNYSPITPLHSEIDVDKATGSINSCIRKLANRNESSGFHKLNFVIGELHDNVWSHGKKSGFSMAQKSKIPYVEDFCFEFALADSGLGFLAEMRRAGKPVGTHREAIEWCILEGHSTKHSDDIDEWAQCLPVDNLGGSPLGKTVQTHSEENHHQGLGLAHLIRLIREYNGELCLVSGDTALQINSSGKSTFKQIKTEWQGVAISCKLKESELTILAPDEDIDEDIRLIMQQLGGSL
jgi:hypothetical protein